MTNRSAAHRAIEDADARLHIAGLPTFTEFAQALALMLENSGNVHANTCALFGERPAPCDCALGVARAALAKVRSAG
jgi:hypothetical protein